MFQKLVLTGELLRMVLHIRQHILIGIGDDKSVTEDLNNRADEHIIWTVEHRFIRGGSWLGYSRSLEELSSNDAGVSHLWLIDGNHIIGQSIADNESSARILWLN